jgi:hypothetical protein
MNENIAGGCFYVSRQFYRLGASMNIGFTEAHLRHFIAVIGSKVEKQQAETAAAVFEKIQAARQ